MDAVEQREAALSARQDALDQRERNLGVLAAQEYTDFVGKASVLFDRLHKSPKPTQKLNLKTYQYLPAHLPTIRASCPTPHVELEGDADPGDPLTPEQQEREFAGHLRLNHPIARDQEDPPVGGIEFPDPELPKPPKVQQPVSDKLR